MRKSSLSSSPSNKVSTLLRAVVFPVSSPLNRYWSRKTSNIVTIARRLYITESAVSMRVLQGMVMLKERLEKESYTYDAV